MLYIQKTAQISPQETILHKDVDTINAAVNGKLLAKEPLYPFIPAGILRRMGKSVKMGVGAALTIIEKDELNGIIIGTANGGMNDCMKFLQQIVDYEEGMLSPGNFVQGVPNAIASQIGLLTNNKGYNNTHVHEGLAFENALMDAAMQLAENKNNSYLVGAVDEISDFYHNIEILKGNFNTDNILAKDFYTNKQKGTIAGEGAALFVVNNQQEGSIAKLIGIDTFNNTDHEYLRKRLLDFKTKYLENASLDLIISGENGDERYDNYYATMEFTVGKDIPVAHFKHLCAEYSTANSYSFWLACQLFQNQEVPAHLLKTKNQPKQINRILIYNTYFGVQQSIILLEKSR